MFCLLFGISGCAQSYTNAVGSASGGSVSEGTGYTGGTVGTGLPGAVDSGIASGMDGEIGARASAPILGVLEREDGESVAGVRLVLEAAGAKQEIVTDKTGRFRVGIAIADGTAVFISQKGRVKSEKLRIIYRTSRTLRVLLDREGKLQEGF